MHLKFDPRVIDQLDSALTKQGSELEELSKQLFSLSQLLIRIKDDTVLYQRVKTYQNTVIELIDEIEALQTSARRAQEIYRKAELGILDLVQSTPLGSLASKRIYAQNRQRILVHNEKLVTDHTLLQLLWLDE